MGTDVGAYFNIEIEFLNRLEVSNVPAKLFDQSLFFYDFKKQAWKTFQNYYDLAKSILIYFVYIDVKQPWLKN